MDKVIEFLNIKNLSQIKYELLEFANNIKNNIAITSDIMVKQQDKNRYGIWGDISEILPNLHSYLAENFNIMPDRYTYYFTPPEQKIRPHIDISPQFGDWIGVNIPVANTENSVTTFYEWDENNMDGRWPIDESKLVIKEAHTMDKPFIINAGVLHGVENLDSQNERIMFLIRWHPRHKFKDIKNENTA